MKTLYIKGYTINLDNINYLIYTETRDDETNPTPNFTTETGLLIRFNSSVTIFPWSTANRDDILFLKMPEQEAKDIITDIKKKCM